MLSILCLCLSRTQLDPLIAAPIVAVMDWMPPAFCRWRSPWTLAGYTFPLDIGDAGDGIGWDQPNWADAKVTLADGISLWLGEMEL